MYCILICRFFQIHFIFYLVHRTRTNNISKSYENGNKIYIQQIMLEEFSKTIINKKKLLIKFVLSKWLKKPTNSIPLRIYSTNFFAWIFFSLLSLKFNPTSIRSIVQSHLWFKIYIHKLKQNSNNIILLMQIFLKFQLLSKFNNYT